MKYEQFGDAVLFCGDALTIIPKLKEQYIDCVVSDPPYGISYEEWDVLHNNTNSSLGKSTKRKHSSKPIRGWSDADSNIGLEYEEWCKKWSVSLATKCKPASALLFFNSRRLMSHFISGFDNFLLQDIICHHKSSSYFQAFRPYPETMPNIRIGNLAPAWEPIIVLRAKFKGTNKSMIEQFGLGGMDVEAHYKHNVNYDNIIKAHPISKKQKYHPTQKDLHTLLSLIKTFSMPKHIVLDPFMGSGSTCVAAILSNRRFVGIERDREYYEIACKRIKEASNKKL